jgi:hypothetical protein
VSLGARGVSGPLAYRCVTRIMISVADQLWEPDGTQPPPPPRVWDDPVAGLVAGERFDDEQFVVDVVEPVMPDMSEVRRAVDAVLSDEPPVVPACRRPIPGRVGRARRRSGSYPAVNVRYRALADRRRCSGCGRSNSRPALVASPRSPARWS